MPGSSERFIAKAVGLEADEIFLDLEDAVAPNEKEAARERVIEALNTLDFGEKTVVVRVNGTDTPHYYKDLIAVVERAGAKLDAIMLPEGPHPRRRRDDRQAADPDRARARACTSAGSASRRRSRTRPGCWPARRSRPPQPRMETLIFGPGDYSAAVGIPITTIGAAPDGYPGDHLNYVYSRLVVAARAAGIQAIDGPYGNIKDEDGLRTRSRLARALGLDGKWTIHPGQIATVNEVFSPEREQWERAEAMLAAYDEAHRAGAGAAVFEGEMIDEANRKMAERIAFAGRAAGYEKP